MNNSYKQMDNQQKRRPLSLHMSHRLREGLFLITIACAFFLLISLLTYHTKDPGWSSSGLNMQTTVNWGGKVGAWLADIFLFLFGVVAYVFPFLIILSSWLSIINERTPQNEQTKERWFHLIGWLLFIASVCGLASLYIHAKAHYPADTGGIIGDILANVLSYLFNKTGTTLLFMTTFLCGVTLVTGLSWLGLASIFTRNVIKVLNYFRRRKTGPLATHPNTNIFIEKPMPRVLAEPVKPIVVVKPEIPQILQLPREKKKTMHSAVPRESMGSSNSASGIKLKPGTLPPLSLLNPPSHMTDKPFANISFEELSQLVEQRLADFGVEVRVVAVHPGPVITRFELELAPGIKVSKISGLAKDISRSLSVVSVRIVEVIPGKSVIGLEIPNENRELVTLREILESQRYAQSRSPVSLVIGKDISGNPVVVDLAKMPHLLVAGTTGSGKSVCLNAMLLSMLFKSTPEQLRLIMIDPKMLELSLYDGVPHLLTPVITDMKDAANALRWCVAEMDKRYRLMASLGVRNLAGYNQKVNDAIRLGQPIPMPGLLVTDDVTAKAHLEPMPMIVVIADELADMMMVVGKKVEDLIARIAQKARAAGIHLIIATQRPSVDVITGLIKANIPTRIAFQVSSRIDSRTILDQQGAEQLLGHGDMLYLPPGAGIPIRVHGAYVADDEVHRVVSAWRSSAEPQYVYEVTEETSALSNNDNGSTGEQDPLYDEAVRIVTESRKASISLVQRRLRIGYNRAARMMEEMEAAGVVSIMDNNGTREVLAGSLPND